MGLFDRWRKPAEDGIVSFAETISSGPKNIAVGAKKDDDDTKFITSFESGKIGYTGEIGDLNYQTLLQNPQDNIITIFQLARYYSYADPLIHSIIHNVYVPFCTSSDWYLTGTKEKTINLYNEYYKKIRLKQKAIGIFTEFSIYQNVYCYVLDGNLITLPVVKTRIANTTLSGQPVLEYDCLSIINELKQKGYYVNEKYAKDSQLDYVLKGYPKEIREAVKRGEQYAQLDPRNCYTLQGPKETWTRYAEPWILTALEPLARKELVKKYERAMLNIASKPIIHVSYGDPKQEMLPDPNQLISVRDIFKMAMKGLPLAVTNHLANPKILQTDLSHLYEWPIYGGVNKDILTAGGISDAIASGESDAGSTFSLGNLSKESAEFRINAMRDQFCEMMNAIGQRLAEDIPGSYNLGEPPEFHMKPLDMSGRKALRETCLSLWEKGTVSTKTMMEMHGYSVEKEKKQREAEAKDGTDEALADRNQKQQSETDGDLGRPTMDDSDRTSDPSKSESGAQPKPSNPDGSNKE